MGVLYLMSHINNYKVQIKTYGNGCKCTTILFLDQPDNLDIHRIKKNISKLCTKHNNVNINRVVIHNGDSQICEEVGLPKSKFSVMRIYNGKKYWFYLKPTFENRNIVGYDIYPYITIFTSDKNDRNKRCEYFIRTEIIPQY